MLLLVPGVPVRAKSSFWVLSQQVQRVLAAAVYHALMEAMAPCSEG